MNTILVVGGDRIGDIENKLKERGVTEIIHVSGRKGSDTKMKIPTSTNLVLVFTDFVNHTLSKHIKNQAKQKNLPIVFCKRSYSAIGKVFQAVN